MLEAFGGAPNLLRKPSLHQRHRVITGQRLLQAALDPFPGYLTHDHRDYDVRQLRNARASIDLDDRNERTFDSVCGTAAWCWRGHAQSPAAPFIHSCLGTGHLFPEAVARWPLAYAEQVETDYATLLVAVASGLLPARGQDEK